MAAQGRSGGGSGSGGVKPPQPGLSSKLMGMKFMQKGGRNQGASVEPYGDSMRQAATKAGAAAALATTAAATAGAAAAVAVAASASAAAGPSSSAPAGEKKVMSSKLMGMRFMQRAVEKQKMQEMVQEQEAKDAEAHWVAPNALGGKRCVVISERDPLPEVALGRMSFKSFNPTTEALQRQPAKGGAAASGANASGKDVSDAEMASQLGKRPYQADHSKVLPLRGSTYARKFSDGDKRQKRH